MQLLLFLCALLSFSEVKALSLQECLLPGDHPLQEILPTLFPSSQLFRSPQTLRQAGFKVNRRVHQKMMVFIHPKVQGYIFKKLQNSVPPSEQVRKYLLRLEGAQTVNKIINTHQLKHLVVPKKWLYPLPAKNHYLVIAERMDILPDQENVLQYSLMNKEILLELCTALKALGGCDAWPRNQPFTKTGQIAFVDTEHVGQKEGHFIKHIVPFLNQQQQKFARRLWKSHVVGYP